MHDGAAWRRAFSAGAIASPLPNPIAERTLAGSGTATATVSFSPNGTVTATGSSPGNWFLPTTAGAGSNFWIRASLASGNSPSGSALNSWLPLSAVVSWSLSRTGLGTLTTQLSYGIAANALGSDLVGSGSIFITAAVEP